jgi:alkylation response protein AidB-like acyl-CoA dehydrogenase
MTATEVQAQAAEDLVDDLVTQLLDECDPKKNDPATFLGTQFDKGLAWVHFPVGHGGLGVNPKLQKLVNERLTAAGAPNSYSRNPIGYGMCGPTVVVWGSEEQKTRYLRPLFTGEEIWCQLFSEPGAGSDFAGLAAFVVDMHAPGVEVLPLRQMTGEAEFNEVFFTNVRIPNAEMLGNPGDGWRVSLTTLMNERVSIGGTMPAKGSGTIQALTSTWATLPDDRKDAASRDDVMKLWSRAEVLRLTNIRANQNRKMGDPGPEGSIAKMAFADLNKDIYAKVMDLMGAEGMLYGSYEMVRPDRAMAFENMQKAFLRSRANSIEGGTTEVMKNILGERVLGLPGDVRVDREVPWSQVPRN